MSKSVKRADCNERGATIVEFSLVVGLFLFVMLTFIDFARIFLVQTLLTKGAQEGLALAAKIQGLGVDNERLDPSNPKAADDYAQFLEARSAVAETAAARLLAVFAARAAENPNAQVRLLSFTHADYVAGSLQANDPSDVLILRPGDSGVDVHGYPIYHPTRCSELVEGCASPRGSGDSMDRMLRDFPMQVRLDALVETFSPWLSDIRVTGLAMGFREHAIKSGFRDGVGNIERLDTPAAPGFDEVDCTPIACNNGRFWSEDSCGCLCESKSCPSGQYWDMWYCECISDYE